MWNPSMDTINELIKSKYPIIIRRIHEMLTLSPVTTSSALNQPALQCRSISILQNKEWYFDTVESVEHYTA